MHSKSRSYRSPAGLTSRIQDRPKQQIAAVRTFTIGTLRYLKIQATTRRKSAIRHQSFARLHPGRSRLYIEKVFAFNRSLDFSDYRTSASKRPDTRRRRFA